MRIDVAHSDIDRGKRGNCLWCPVANAIDKVLHDDMYAVVYENAVKICVVPTKDSEYIFLPQEAIDFIANFDNHNPVKPFSFELPCEHLLS